MAALRGWPRCAGQAGRGGEGGQGGVVRRDAAGRAGRRQQGGHPAADGVGGLGGGEGHPAGRDHQRLPLLHGQQTRGGEPVLHGSQGLGAVASEQLGPAGRLGVAAGTGGGQHGVPVRGRPGRADDSVGLGELAAQCQFDDHRGTDQGGGPGPVERTVDGGVVSEQIREVRQRISHGSTLPSALEPPIDRGDGPALARKDEPGDGLLDRDRRAPPPKEVAGEYRRRT